MGAIDMSRFTPTSGLNLRGCHSDARITATFTLRHCHFGVDLRAVGDEVSGENIAGATVMERDTVITLAGSQISSGRLGNALLNTVNLKVPVTQNLAFSVDAVWHRTKMQRAGAHQ